MKGLIALLFRLALKTRYRVRLNSRLGNKKISSTIILPNHPAEIDPVIITSYLWHIASPRAVVLETVFKMPVLKSIFSYIGAIPMPDMEQGSGFYKRKRIKQTLDNLVSSLQHGDNVLMYPSGRLSVDGREVLGGASGAYTIIQRLDSGNVLLVRSKGLWGSRFSKAQTGGLRPNIGKAFLSGAKTVFKNFIFFVPKRRVDLTLEEFSIQDLKSKSLAELNSFLETWYAQEGIEQVSYISDSFLTPNIAPPTSKTAEPETDVALEPEKREKILSHLAKISQKPADIININMKLGEDLGLDSLTIAELVTWLHDELECEDLELSDLINVNSVFKAAANKLTTKKHIDLAATPQKWNASVATRLTPQCPKAKSLAEAFILSAKRNNSRIACADARLGIKSYFELLAASLVLSKNIAKLPDQHIGIILPASGMSAIVIFATLIAKKTPVFLNWTSGTRSLEHSISLLSINSIISAGAVLDSINHDLSPFEDKFLLLEEMLQSASAITKIISVLESALPARTLLRHLKLDNISEEDTAVVLFTSGSEAAPKGVPLSNKNILENISSISEIFRFQSNDVIYGFLPPFHSFGLTVTTLMPILCGIRVCFYSNPNESRKIAQGCNTWQVTALAGTPAFIKGILSAGDPETFSNLRLLMSGADKLGNELRDLCKLKAPKATLLEGYGITECSPVVCAQRPGTKSPGVGPPLPQVRIKVVSLDSMTEVQGETPGLVLISGPNVFPGYLGEAKDPFINFDGDRWYNSGDLGFLSNGSLVLSGRLKRFIKIGGEMISLPALEDALIKKLGKQNENSALAIVDKEDPQTKKPLLTVFCNYENLNRESAQEILKESGFPALVKLNEVKYLKELPLLGSGKIDIQSLKQNI